MYSSSRSLLYVVPPRCRNSRGLWRNKQSSFIIQQSSKLQVRGVFCNLKDTRTLSIKTKKETKVNLKIMKIRIKRKKKKSKKTEVVQPKEDTPLLLISPSLDAAALSLSTSEESLSRARRLLYLSHLAATFTEIGWEFCLVLFLSALTGYQSLTLVSTYGLFSGLVVCLGGPSVGALIDTIKYTRLEVIQFFIVIQNLSVVIATVGCFSLLRMVKDTDITGFTNANSNVDSRSLASGQPTISSHTFSNFIPPFNGTTLLFLLSIHVFGAIAKLTDHAITIALERDWIVVMSKVAAMDIDDDDEVDFLTATSEKEYEEGKSFDSSYSTTTYSVGSLSLDDREGMDTRVIRKLKQRSWLSETNTSMKQIDLMSKVVAPAAGGFLLSVFDNNDPLNKLATDIQHWYNLSYAAVIIGILNLASLYIEFRCTKEIYCLVPSLASHSNKKVERNNDIEKIPSDSFTNSIGCGIFTLPKSISLYLQQPVAEAGLALALL